MSGRMLRTVATTAMLALALCGLTARGQEVLNPPYGLRWGDSPEKLISWAQGHGYDITTTIPGKQPALSVIRIAPAEGLITGSKASAIEGRFLGGKLYEMTVDYSDPAAGADAITARFEELKRQIAREYGPMLADQQQRTVSDQFATRTESFHREPLKGLFLLLAYTEVEDLLRKTKDARFSLIYRNDNFRKEMEAALQEKP